MLRIAEALDYDRCKTLLQQIGSVEKINQNYLYLNDTRNGFTIVVEKNKKLVALSTFTIRRVSQKNKNYSFLYWENLIVDKNNRDGVAYLSIIGYVRKLLRRREFDDIYFVARRKEALKVHKAARFKKFGYFQLTIGSIKFNQKANCQNNLTYLDYDDFSSLFDSDNEENSKSVKKYIGLENSSNHEIQRWLFGKEGKIVLDEINKRIYFLRSLFKNKFLEINLVIPSCYKEKTPDLSEFCNGRITINLKIRRCANKQEGIQWYLPKLTYEALSFNEQKLLDNFEIWEHDAW